MDRLPLPPIPEIASALRAGGRCRERAAEALWRALRRVLHAAARRALGGCGADRDVCVSEAFVRIVRALEGGAEVHALVPWACAFVANVAREQRRQGRNLHHGDGLAAHEWPRRNIPDPERLLAAKQARARRGEGRVAPAPTSATTRPAPRLRPTPPVRPLDHRVLQLAESGRSSPEIARLLALTPGAVRTRLYRARRRKAAGTALPVPPRPRSRPTPDREAPRRPRVSPASRTPHERGVAARPPRTATAVVGGTRRAAVPGRRGAAERPP